MDKLLISYKLRSDWYVGEIYRFIHSEFERTYPNIKFEFVENDIFKQRYNLNDYVSNYPSTLNQYNLIILNPKNDKTFINSLHDFAPFCLYPNTGVENFDVQKFTFVSNFYKNILGPIEKFNPEPSFYILENFSDLNRVSNYRNTPRTIDKAHFLGLMYGRRNTYSEIFQNSDLVEIQSKENPTYFKPKNEYFQAISQYSMSLSVDGAAKICHRDIECLGLGNLLVRENLDIEMRDPLIPNIHYLEILNQEQKLNFNSSTENEKNYYKALVEDKILSVINDKKVFKEIVKNGILWYENNCTPKKQFETINELTNNLNILY